MPGAGLLWLRAALAATVFVQAGIFFSGQFHPSFWILLAEIAAIVCGFSVAIGFLTPIAAALLLTGGLITCAFWLTNSIQSDFWPLIYGIMLAAAVLLLGPGAYSLDARAFGRREILIPKN